MRTRKWFITINIGAECFSNVQTILNNERCNYLMILHDKDNEEQPHYHCCVKYDNAHSFESVCHKFTGAHVQPCEYWNMSCQYLLHINDKSKFQYSYKELISNFKEDELNTFLMLDEYEKLTTENLLLALKNNEINDITDCILRWGINQVGNKYRLLEVLIAEHKHRSYLESEGVERDRTKELLNFAIHTINIYREYNGLCHINQDDLENDLIRSVYKK